MIISYDENGNARMMASNNNNYLVTYDIEGENYTHIETARTIFNKMDMSDCYDISIVSLFLIRENGRVSECVYRGTWHNGKDPLLMAIQLKRGGRVIDEGYGTDH